jgi:predicted transcriptional regulator of viral defense system
MSVIRRLVERGDLEKVPELKHVYVVISPYAVAIPLSDEQIIQEADPLCFFSHLTALAHHGITDVIPNRIYASTPVAETHRLPLGTSAEDWFELPLPIGQGPARLRNVQIVWSRPVDEQGVAVAFSQGASIYVTDLERTLLDVLREPTKAHGITTVLKAWRIASENWELDRLLRYADRGPIVRQRVGFLVERLGQSHPLLNEWKQKLQRGGSLRLVANQPYSPVFSDSWNLSLNVPESVLAVLDD